MDSKIARMIEIEATKKVAEAVAKLESRADSADAKLDTILEILRDDRALRGKKG